MPVPANRCAGGHDVPSGNRFCGVCGGEAVSVMTTPEVAIPSTVADKIVFAAAAGLAVGAFLPWVKATAPLIGTLTKSGMDGGDGVFLLVGALVLAALAWAINSNGATSTRAYGIVVISGLALALVIYEISDVNNKIEDIGSDLVVASVGAGLYLSAVAAVTGIIGGLMAVPKSHSPGS